MNNINDKIQNAEYVKYGLALYALFAPLALRIPELRNEKNNKSALEIEKKVKKTMGRYQVIIKLIEGEKKYLEKKDEDWGSVIALVDTKTKEPVVGIVAHPIKRLFYFGIKNWGAYVLGYDSNNTLILTNKMSVLPDLGYEKFSINQESNALQAVRNRGSIFKNSGPEMAAVYVIINELGGKITDVKESNWTVKSNSVIVVRKREDWQDIKKIQISGH